MKNTNLRSCYREHRGKTSDKWSNYLAEYDRLLAPLRRHPVRLLEIGIQNGGSLEIWKEYFPQAEKLVGCDIDPECARLHYDDPRIAVVIGHADTEESEKKITAHAPEFDCIIDDGSHISGEIIGAFYRYFRYLRQGGVYIVEDLHCSYWQEFEGGLFHPFSAIAFFKRLIDVVNHDFWGTGKTADALLENFSRFRGTDCRPLPMDISSVEFINSICVIRKGENCLGPRVIAGETDAVVSGHLTLRGTDCEVPDQTDNLWAAAFPQEEEMTAALAERERHIAALQQAMAEEKRQRARSTAEITLLKESLAAGEGRNAAMKPLLAARERLISDLRERLAERDRLLQEILSSESWRWTSPLRFAGLHGKRLRRHLQVVPERVQSSGGLRPALSKALAIFRNEGMHGLRRRWRSRAMQPVNLPEAVQFRTPTAALVFDPQTGYVLAETSAGYTYIPPRAPEHLTRICEAMQRQTRFSILVPVYNTPPDILQKMIDSVLAQWYTDWELVLADDASTDPLTRECLAQLDHPAVTVVHLPENRGISGASNAALAQAKGDFIVLLDHDDELTQDCLFELALCIERENPDYIYSDEDKIDAAGRFTEPHFKPDWSPDTLMSTMYVCHVSCIRRELLVALEGFRSGYDGCQDWDLILRLTERTQRICHLPKVLYHWRIIPASTAADIAAKPYVLESSRRVREEALTRRGLPGTVEAVEQVKGYFRVNYHLQDEPLISIIVPTRDNAAILRRCLASILERSTYRNFEILLIDNGSIAPTTLAYLEEVRGQEQVTVIRHDRPFNFSELNNIGAARAAGELLLFLNDDTEVLTVDWLQRLGGYARLPHIGAVGAKLLYPGGERIQHAGIINLVDGPMHAFCGLAADHPGYFMRNLLEYDWLAVTGACLMLEKATFLAVGGFDEKFPVAYNDIDLCLRLGQGGLFNVVCQAVRLIHHESASRGQDFASAEKRARLDKEKRSLFAAHPLFFQHDPFHNPNLHPDGTHFEVVP